MDDMTIEQIIASRDLLQENTHNIFKTSLKTDSDSYPKAQEALKKEQFLQTKSSIRFSLNILESL